jgi:mannose-6-phosphate isomerase-like protein (cupin superfamily)
MPIIKHTAAPSFALPGLTVTGLASPSRGAQETSVWRLSIAPGTPGTEHTVDREEVFVAMHGHAVATLAGQRHELHAGDALIVPAHVPFSLANPGPEPFEAVAALPVGGRAAMLAGEPSVPPWAV